MAELYNFGLSDLEINNIIQICPNILDLSNEDIIKNIEILKNIGCSNEQIKNIILTNPFYLDKIPDDNINLIDKLIEIEVTDINLLIDTNPFLLNKEYYEIDNYIQQEINKGKNINDIMDELESNPYIIDEN